MSIYKIAILVYTLFTKLYMYSRELNYFTKCYKSMEEAKLIPESLWIKDNHEEVILLVANRAVAVGKGDKRKAFFHRQIDKQRKQREHHKQIGVSQRVFQRIALLRLSDRFFRL